MSEARVTNPFVEQFRRGGVPTELRLMAAQGVLPLKPEDLLELLADLVKDPEAAVAEAAKAALAAFPAAEFLRSEEHTSELQSRRDLVCRLLLEKKKTKNRQLLRAQKKTNKT